MSNRAAVSRSIATEVVEAVLDAHPFLALVEVADELQLAGGRLKMNRRGRACFPARAPAGAWTVLGVVGGLAKRWRAERTRRGSEASPRRSEHSSKGQRDGYAPQKRLHGGWAIDR